MGRSHGLGLPRSLVVSVQHPSKRRPAPIEELECRQRSLVEVCIQMHEREKAVAQRIRSGWKQTRMIMHPLRSDVPAHVLEVRLEFSGVEAHAVCRGAPGKSFEGIEQVQMFSREQAHRQQFCRGAEGYAQLRDIAGHPTRSLKTGQELACF